MNKLAAPLTIDGRKQRGLSRLLRARLLTPGREHGHPGDCQHCRLLLAAVNNTNLIARRCADLADPQAAVQVIAHLAALERELRQAAGVNRK